MTQQAPDARLPIAVAVAVIVEVRRRQRRNRQPVVVRVVARNGERHFVRNLAVFCVVVGAGDGDRLWNAPVLRRERERRRIDGPSVASVEVTSTVTAADGAEVRLTYGPVPAGGPTAMWYTLPGATLSSVTIGASSATRIDFAITDGGLGDDTAIDGVIVDQGGPGAGTAQIPLFGPYRLLMMTLLMAFAAAWVLAKGRG